MRTYTFPYETKTLNRTEQNICLFRHSAYIAHSPNTNTAWKRKMKSEKKKTKT